MTPRTPRRAPGLDPAGFSVFPVALRESAEGRVTKQPLVKWREGSKPRAEWRGLPRNASGWGIDCEKSGIVVLDEDRPGALREFLGFEPETYTVRTGKGRHYYFAAPPGVPIKNSAGQVAPGLDVRAAGGYVVAPGAERPDGRRYEIERELPIAALPPVLAAALPRKAEPKAGQVVEVRDRTAYCQAALEGVLGPLADFGVDEGGRNNALNRAALKLGHLVGDQAAGYLDEAEVRQALAEWAQDAGLPAEEAAATIESGLQAGMADPRELVESGGPREVEPDSAAERMPRLDLGALLSPDRPPREYVVAPLLPAGVAVALVAPAGHRKSLFSLRLAVAVALGEDGWAGLEIPRARRVCYVDMENTEDDLAERLLSFGLTPADAPRLDLLVVLSLPDLPPLDSAEGGELLLAALDAYGLTKGDLVVLDSYQRVTIAGENDADTTRGYYRHTGRRLKERGLTVIRTDNTGKDRSRGARGSSGKRDDVDAELLITSEGERLRISLGSKIRQRGVPEISLRVVEAGGLTTFEADAVKPREDVLRAVEDALSDGQWHGTNEVERAAREAGARFKRDRLLEALKWLTGVGTTQRQEGPNKSTQYRLIRASGSEDFEDEDLL